MPEIRIPAVVFLGAVAALIAVSGCKEQGDVALAPAPRVAMRVLVVGDPVLAETIGREWYARSDEELQVVRLEAEQLTAKSALAAEVVVYPPHLLGQFAESEQVVSLDRAKLAASGYKTDDLLKLSRKRTVHWGNRQFAVSLGQPHWILFYRQDLFEKHDLKPPRTWDEYQQVCQRLDAARRADPDRWPQRICIEPLAAGWAGNVLLARSAAYVSSSGQASDLFDFKTMKPLIDGPPFQRALQQLVTASQLDKPPGRLSPADARQAIVDGRAVIGWSWPTAAAVSTQSDKNAGKSAGTVAGKTAARVSIGVAALPGGSQFYDAEQKQWRDRSDGPVHVPLLGMTGRLASICRDTRSLRQSRELVAWLSDPEIGSLLSQSSSQTAPYRDVHLREIDSWTGRELRGPALENYTAIIRSENSSVGMFSLRIPGAARYLHALDEAVWSAVDGDQSPAEALQSASRQWQKITDELGVKPQKNAYHRSLGIEPR